MTLAIIGFGYSGAMVLANVVRAAAAPCTVYLITETLDPRGVAYATRNPFHLLNVRAENMSAVAEDADHFVRWLAQHHAGHYTAKDFVPRSIYGDYLEAIWQETQALAQQKHILIRHVPSRAVAIQQGTVPAVLTARGDAIAAPHIVLAVGHEVKPILTGLPAASVLQNPWKDDAFADAAAWASPVALMGMGLTAIDVLFSLRHAGYTGEVIACSRRGYVPQAHQDTVRAFAFAAEEIAAQKTLRGMLRMVRRAVAHHGDWRAVVDALRPHTQALWQRLSPRDQQRFLTRLSPLWNTHRHRMAPEIAARLAAERASGGLRLLSAPDLAVKATEDALLLTCDGETVTPSRLINCTGLELNLARSANPLLRQLLAEGLVEPHGSLLGVVADPSLRAWGRLHPHLFVLGSLLTGQLLESTAVPELRVQAARIAHSILS